MNEGIKTWGVTFGLLVLFLLGVFGWNYYHDNGGIQPPAKPSAESLRTFQNNLDEFGRKNQEYDRIIKESERLAAEFRILNESARAIISDLRTDQLRTKESQDLLRGTLDLLEKIREREKPK